MDIFDSLDGLTIELQPNGRWRASYGNPATDYYGYAVGYGDSERGAIAHLIAVLLSNLRRAA